jgi:hypothetical protein
LQEHHHQATTAVQSLQIFNAEAQHNAKASTSSTYTLQPHTDSPPPGMQPSMQQDPRNPSYLAAVPARLQGCRCYVDASTAPDQPN